MIYFIALLYKNVLKRLILSQIFFIVYGFKKNTGLDPKAKTIKQNLYSFASGSFKQINQQQKRKKDNKAGHKLKPA